MKILFYDGYLEPKFINFDAFDKYRISIVLDAMMGPTKVSHYLKENFTGEPETTVLTNSLICLDHRYGWNKQENHTNIYFWVESKEDFVRCDQLAEREIRYGHDIMKMYMNGEFA